MKIKNILPIVLALTAFSCEDFIGGDLNADPNKPLDVPISGQLGQIQIQMADTYGGGTSRWNCMFSQQVEGVARQWDSFNDYVVTANRFDADWSDMYENVIVELRTVTAIAEEDGLNHYLGVAKVLEATAIMNMTDMWGDIPYTEAGLGADNFSPVYDDQATVIYPAIRTLLTDALGLFAGPAGPIAPGSEDLYHGGDVTAWTRTANALLARYYLHLGDYANALSSAQNAYTDRSQNMGYQYGSDPASHPWYRFNNGREGDIEFHPTMRGIMTGLNDTDRLGVIDQTFTINGTPHPYFVAALKQDLISYREIQFIIAECEFQLNGNTATAQTAYLNGINASFQELGFADGGAEYTAYVAQPSVAAPLDMNKIMTQKYIAMFAQPETWSDWRRTGIPALTPTSGSAVPTNWDYAQNSYFFNSNSPSEMTAPASLLRGVDWLSNW
ncbi:SusD/RagB family nutrient-binding outer membrane lipoprotein [Ekhidna sp.]|uniref:SusD/RagB family nutrient-binding outer membrane lipoprotein n=1 Tax=Ekhidna sp. TaxID=2608089 RepID=UPI003B51019A